MSQPNNNLFEIIHPTAKCADCATNVNITQCARCKKDEKKVIFYCEPCFVKHALDHETLSVIADCEKETIIEQKQRSVQQQQQLLKVTRLQYCKNAIKRLRSNIFFSSSIICIETAILIYYFGFSKNSNKCWLI